MGKMKLYIIGNGFDLYHGIKSSFWNFKDFVEESDPDLYEKIEWFFGGENFWSDFEAYLGYIDEDNIRDYGRTFLMDYGAEDWSDAGHHDYQYEISRIIDGICNGLTAVLLEWIMQLTIAKTQNDAIDLPKDAIYLSFNYTDTLEQLYHINPDNIVYIHNKAIDDNSELIYGHNIVINPPKSDDEIISEINIQRKIPLSDFEIQEILDDLHSEDDPRVAEGDEIIRGYYETTFKPVDNIIRNNQDFFNKLSNIEEIYILGHSLNDIDLPYFRHIYEKIGNDTKWNVSYYGEKEKDSHKEILKSIGISESKISFIRIDDLSIEPKLNFKS